MWIFHRFTSLVICSFFACTQISRADDNLKLIVTNSRLPTAVYGQSATYDGDDSVYLVGGLKDGGGRSDQVVKYSLGTGAVSVIGTFQAIDGGAALMDNDDLIYMGGRGSANITLDIYRISTLNGGSVRVSSLPEPALGLHAAWDRVNGVGYLFGGSNGSIGGQMSSVWMYNASNDVTSQVGRLPEVRGWAGTVWDPEHNMAYIFGGEGSGPIYQDILRFNPATGEVTKLAARLPQEERYPNVVYSDHSREIIIVDAVGLVSFDPNSHVVKRLAVSGWPLRLFRPACVFVAKLARIYIFGGNGRHSGETNYYFDDISYVSLRDDEGSTTEGPGTEPPTELPTVAPTSLPPFTTEQNTDQPSTEAPFCPPTGVHNFPYPGNCTLYIRCFDGIDQILSCSPLLFDQIDLVCKPPSEAVCDEEIPIQCPPTGYETHPHPSSCSKYYECVNGNAYESECALSTYFDTNPDLMHCNLAHLAICNSECPLTGIAFIPIRARECNWYKVCIEGNSANLECGNGEVYSPLEGKCVSSDAYMCPYAADGDAD